MASLFMKRSKRRVASKLEDLTLRGFGGGLNIVDDDTNVEPKYQTVLKNFRRTTSGGQKIRYGSHFFADISGVITGNVLEMIYFNNRLVVVSTTGQICTITDLGVRTAIWTPAAAAALPGAPAGWNVVVTQVDFVPFKDHLIVHNGVDKPISISSAFFTTYLQDAGTGSNVNVPIGKYGCVAANYHCVAGIPAAKTTVYISSKGTDGTFPGDPAPNDSLSLDVGAYAPSGAPEILAVAGYRTKLIVFFRGQSLIIQLGEYNTAGTTHVPRFQDTMPQFGILNHRCIVEVGNDLFFAGLDGLASATRNLFSDNINSKSLSALVEPLWRNVTAQFYTTLPLVSFLFHNPIEHSMSIYIPGTPSRVLTYQANAELKYEAWAEDVPPYFSCACPSFLGRVFLGGQNAGTKIFQMGNRVFSTFSFYGTDEFPADLIAQYRTAWLNSHAYVVGDHVLHPVSLESYTCKLNHTSSAVASFPTEAAAHPELWEVYMGEAITFQLDLPWTDGRTPMRTKHNKFISLDTRGTAAFTVQAYVDFQNPNTTTPAIQFAFVGNDAVAGARSNDPQLYEFPVKFKALKTRISGSTTLPLTIASIKYLFQKGKYRR